MKSEVYSWRPSRDLKRKLEEAARRERVSLARLLERIAREWLKAKAGAAEDEEAEQERLRAVAMRFVGTIRGGDPDRAAEAGKRVRELLARKYGRQGTDRHRRILAFLDRDDRWHEPCVVSLATLRLPLATSAAVLTEVFHLLRNQPRQ